MSVYLYIAAPQCGKSTLMQHHVYELPHVGVRAFLVVDRDMQGTWPGLVFTSAAAFRRHPVLPRFSIFQGVSGAEVAELALELGDCTLVDEEIHRTIVERPWKPWRRSAPLEGHPLYTILHEGAHVPDAYGVTRCVNALLATRRPQNLPGDLPALCNGVYLGHLSSFADADRCYREGWVPQASSPRAARAILDARPSAEQIRAGAKPGFSFVRVA